MKAIIEETLFCICILHLFSVKFLSIEASLLTPLKQVRAKMLMFIYRSRDVSCISGDLIEKEVCK